MSHAQARTWLLSVALIALLAVAFTAGCTQSSSSAGGGSSAGSASTQPAPANESAKKEAEQPEYRKWIVYINDDDSFSQGGITYKISLNFTATNPSANPGGTYTGKAVARTTTDGTVGKGTLHANAIANSGTLKFKLTENTGADPSNDSNANDPLAPLTDENMQWSGSGTITMKAAGTARVGAAAGGFSNTSSQPIKLSGSGDKITLTVPIQGHTYSFTGTIRGEE